MHRSPSKLLSILLVPLFLVAAGGVSFADDFDFGDEEFDFGEDAFDFGEEDFEFGEDDFDFSDDAFEFEEVFEAADEDVTPVVDREVRVTAMMVPTGPISGAQADALTAVIFEQLREIPNVIVVGNEGLVDEFEIMGADLALECAFDAVCLGRYGRELGYDHLVIGRVNETPAGDWSTTINRVEAEQNAITNYRTFTTSSRLMDVSEALPAQVGLLYGIRPERVRADAASGAWQRGVAYGSLGASAVSLGLGVFFAMQARSTENDLRETPVGEAGDGQPVYERTQREVEDEINRGQRQTNLANAMFATSAGLAIISGVFFLVQPGSDIDLDADIVQSPRGFQLTPRASANGAGVSGSFRF